MSNCVGVIDSGYRGEVCSIFYVPENATPYAVGDRCAQLIVMPYPQVQTVETDELSETARGTGGFGSTGA
jgi:dUTP pyrophosphatase